MQILFVILFNLIGINEADVSTENAQELFGIDSTPNVNNTPECMEEVRYLPSTWTLCMFLYVRRYTKSQKSAILAIGQWNKSYTVAISPIGLSFMIESMVMEDDDYSMEHFFEPPLPVMTWRHICLEYHIPTDSVIVKCVVDGIMEKLSNQFIISRKKERGEYLCIGSPTFDGIISDIKIWPDLYKPFMFPCTSEVEEIIPTIQVDTQYSKAEGIKLNEICTKPNSVVLLQPAEAYNRVNVVCESLGGTLPSKIIDTKVLETARGNNFTCVSNDNITSWIINENINDGCDAVTINGEVRRLSCVRRLLCSICITSAQKYTLYGHQGDYFDHVYFIKIDESGSPSWLGIGESQITKRNSSWVLSSNLHGTEWILDGSLVPVGRYLWKPIAEGLGDEPLVLALTPCKSWQFGCNDGTCIDIIQRCDDVIHCVDRSDEENCDVLWSPTGYDAIYAPPPRPGETIPIVIDYHVDVYNLETMTTEEGVARMDLGITMTWYDPRIKLRNLKPERKNYFACSRIWVPLIRAVSGHGKGSVLETNQYEKFCFAFAKNKTVDRLLSEPNMEHTANGDKYPLVHYLGLLAAVPCEFSLYTYPFDVQYCNLSFAIMNAPGLRIFRKATPGQDVPYLNAKTDLLEYELRALTTDVGYFMQGGDNNTYFVITFHLHRLYGYHITNSYFPSLLMIIISYTTYYYQLEDFQNRIMISLTAQLVLASLFTSTTASSVKTPYLKLIDVWYAAVITFCFTITVTQVWINVLLNSPTVSKTTRVLLWMPRTPEDACKVNGFVCNGDGKVAAKRCNKLSSCVILVTVIIFIFVYSLLSLQENLI